MDYVPPFKVIRDRVSIVTVNGTSKVGASYDEFIGTIKLFLRGVVFDEEWYITKYPDVAEAVKGGIFKSGRHHFIEVGYFEGRRPMEFDVDERWYLQKHQDVADCLARGEIRSARQHFNEHGYTEGRLPSDV